MKDYGLPVSAATHVLVLAAALFALPGPAPLPPAVESLPVEIMTPEQFDALTKGEKTAKPQDKPQTRADKAAAPTPVEESRVETVKREAVAQPPERPPLPEPKPEQMAKLEPTPPVPEPPQKPEPKPPEPVAKTEPPKPAPKVEPPKPEPPKPVAKAEPPKPEPKKVEPPKPEPKPIPKAETQKLDELALKAAEPDKPVEQDKKPEPPKPVEKPVEKPAEKPNKVAEAKAAEAKAAEAKAAEQLAKLAEAAANDQKAADAKPSKPDGASSKQREFNAADISKLLAGKPSSARAALNSKEAPARAATADARTSTTAALGSPRGTAVKLSLSERNALVGSIRQQVAPCWSSPTFAADPSKLSVLIEVNLNPDGTLSTAPSVLKYPQAGGSGAAVAGAAIRAIQRCVTDAKPLKLPGNLYEGWKNLEINFNPAEMEAGG